MEKIFTWPRYFLLIAGLSCSQPYPLTQRLQIQEFADVPRNISLVAHV